MRKVCFSPWLRMTLAENGPDFEPCLENRTFPVVKTLGLAQEA
jgi:hypothetical protein